MNPSFDLLFPHSKIVFIQSPSDSIYNYYDQSYIGLYPTSYCALTI